MRAVPLVTVFFLAIGATPPASAANSDSLRGDNVWVFAVSVLEFRKGSGYVSFPKKDRRDAALVRHFMEDRGVPADHVVWMKDSKATLARVRTSFRKLLGRSKKGDILFLYYTGHGDREKPGVTFFIPFDAASESNARTAWAAPEIIKEIEERFRGDRAFLAADCCHSGGLCRQAQAAGRRVSYACLASAQSSSESTGEWTFTDVLLRGLTGGSSVDADGDGAIALGDLAGHIERELAFAEGQLSASALTGSWGHHEPVSPSEVVLAAVSRRENGREMVLVRGIDGADARAFAAGDCAAPGGPGKRVDSAGENAPGSECLPVSRVKPYHPPAPARSLGSTVYAEWEKSWYKAVVEDFRLGLYHISYEGWGSYWDEWVPAERLRGDPPCSPVPCEVEP